MKLRIAVISSDFPAPGHPYYIFVEQLVNAMVDLGCEISVIAPQSITRHLLRGVPKMPKLSSGLTAKGNTYKIYRPSYISLSNSTGIIQRFVNCIKKHAVQKILNKQKIDILYTHFWENAILVHKYALSRGIPLFVACGEGDQALENLNATLSEKKKEGLKKIINGVISVSSENKRKCIEYNLVDENRIEVIPNCVDTNLFKPCPNLELKTKLGIKNDDFTIAFVGGFIHRKGAKRVSDAINKLNDPHIKSIFIGQPFANDCEIPECEGIVFKGPVDHDEIPMYLNCADVFVLPTLKEGCCNAIVEALSVGLPVISSTGSFNDDIIDSSNSIRIDPLDIDEIAEAIKKIKDNHKFRDNLHKNIIENKNKYSIECRASKIIDFLNNHKIPESKRMSNI